MNDSPKRQTRSTGRRPRSTPPPVCNHRRRNERARRAGDTDPFAILELHDVSTLRVSLEWLAREAELAQYELAAPTATSTR